MPIPEMYYPKPNQAEIIQAEDTPAHDDADRHAQMMNKPTVKMGELAPHHAENE